MTGERKQLTKFIAIIVLALAVGLVSYPKVVSKIPPIYNVLNKLKINLGLDLQGGIHLEYKADTGQLSGAQVDQAMQSLQDVIEKRVNAFGVAEPTIYTTKTGSERRLVVELAGVKDINQAKEMIKETPFLEFKKEASTDDLKEYDKLFESTNAESKKKADEVLKRALKREDFSALAKEFSQDPGSKEKGGDLDFVKKGALVPEFDKVLFEGKLSPGEINQQLVETQFGWHIIKYIEAKGEGDEKEVHSQHILFAKQSAANIPDFQYKSTGLSGKNLKSASVEFTSQGVTETQVALRFDDEGTKLFADLTKENLGKQIAIYLDGQIISAPTVQAEITNGSAVITGSFTIDEANNLAGRLNAGALPVPINLISQESVDASLGGISLQKSLMAGVIGLGLVIVFMLIYYRFLGLIASLALLIYAGMMISIFKLSAFITLTLPGIAGFILSIGMAVDANILIFERTKEEVRRGRNILGAIDEGFKRAWTSIRDGNVSSIITAVILIEMGTGFVKGFAVTLVIGVLLSMFTAVVISRNLLKFFMGEWIHDKLWLIGVKSKDVSDNVNKK